VHDPNPYLKGQGHALKMFGNLRFLVQLISVSFLYQKTIIFAWMLSIIRGYFGRIMPRFAELLFLTTLSAACKHS
jgi:hypothetical protein